MLLVFNLTPFGAKVGDSEAEEMVLEFYDWLKNPTKDIDPRDIFGDAYTFPLIKESQDEEVGGLWNCDEWRVDVDSLLVIYAARTLVHENKIPLEHIKIMADGVDCGLTKNGRFQNYYPDTLDSFDNYLVRLLTPQGVD